MKLLISLILITLSAPALSKVFFQALTDHNSGHELTWNFQKPVKEWGKKDLKQVILLCDGQPLEKASKIFWANQQTLKLVPAKNFSPGAKCEASLNLDDIKQTNKFLIAKATIRGREPYGNDITEDSVIVLGLDTKIEDEKIASLAYMEIEGLREKIEFDAVKGDLKEELIKKTYLEGNYKVVLKPRRKYLPGKKFVFQVPENMTYLFQFSGTIREDFKLTMRCERSKADAPCSPVSKIHMSFNGQVKPEMFSKIKLSDGKKVWKLTPPESIYVTEVTFPTKLNPSTEYTVTLENGIEDLDGRNLSNQKKFPLVFTTGNYPPIAKFPGPFGILEANAEPIIPVSVRNIEKKVRLKKNSTVISLNNPKIFGLWLSAIDKRQDVGFGDQELRAKSIFEGSKISIKEEVLNYQAGRNEIEVLGLPANKKGLHLVELHSPILAGSLLEKQKDFYISTAVLVTNLVAHFKTGESDSLVWVTTLDKGDVIPDANVKVYDCNGNLLGSSKTNSKGVAVIPEASKKNLDCSGKIEAFNYKLLVTASKGDDSTFTLSSWNQGIENWRFNVPYYYGDQGQDKGHTVFDRPIYKVNDKVHMLHLLRSQADQGLAYSKNKYATLKIIHADSNQEWKQKIKWLDAGTATSEFTIPANAPQGMYYLSLIKNEANTNDQTVSVGEFLVKDFRVPLMRSEIHFQDRKEKYPASSNLKVLGRLEYLGGGAAGNTPITLRGEITPNTREVVNEYSDYVFNFAGIDEKYDYNSTTLDKKVQRTDKEGNFLFELDNLPQSKSAQNISVEIEYLDPNGVYQTNMTHTRVYPFETLIGIKNPENVWEGKKANFEIVILDLKNKPLKNSKYEVILYKERYLSSRKKIIGGFYTYDSSTKREEVAEICKGKTNSKGLAKCQIKVEESGSHYLIVKANNATGKTQFYSYGKDYAWAPQEHHDRIDLITEKKDFRPGDMAKITMKLPFEKATVLITKERGGVKDSYVTPYDRTNPFLLVPIDQSDFPNVFLSALAVRGRIGSPAPTGLVDLSRPSYKIGLKELKVERDDNNLNIEMIPDKEKYDVRDKVKLKIKVTSQDGSPLKNTNVAITVFDEGLLLLNGHNSFDVAKSLIRPYSHGVNTATAQTHIIGKRHFGLKARPHGGGGGKDLKPRELFDTLIYWNPSLALNKNGEAEVEFKLNDSLTSFKIYGLAYSSDKFGSHDTKIVATQDIMTFVGTSPEIRTGDNFSAIYTLKNITSVDKTIRTKLTLEGKTLKEEQITLKGSESITLTTPVPSFENAGAATYVFVVTEGKKTIDTIKTIQKISALETPRTEFSDLKQITAPIEIKGYKQSSKLFGTEIILSSTLSPSLESLQEYMRSYPYNCLEQKLARATILEDSLLHAKIDRELQSYIDDRGFLKYYPTPGKGSVQLTSHFLEVNFLNKTSTSKDEMLAGTLKTFVDGYITNLDTWEKKEFKNLKRRAMVALKLTGYSQFSEKWLNEISSPSPTDSIDLLLDKWVLFSPGEKAKVAFELIQSKLKIDGSMVTIAARKNSFFDFLYNLDTTIFGRFLLIQKLFPLDTPFNKFYQDNEGKFIRGFMGLREQGHFGGTTANTYAYLLTKRWETKSPITGKTEVSQKSSLWKKNTADPILLDKTEATQDQVLVHKGEGHPWADIRTLTYPDKDKGADHGIELNYKLSNLESHSTFEVQDRVEMKLTLNVKNDMRMGAINLPLPSGITIIETSSDIYLDYEERTESNWRGYFNEIQKGKHEITVIFRLNQAGSFEIPGARMEAMYSPDVFGETPYWKMKIK